MSFVATEQVRLCLTKQKHGFKYSSTMHENKPLCNNKDGTFRSRRREYEIRAIRLMMQS